MVDAFCIVRSSYYSLIIPSLMNSYRDVLMKNQMDRMSRLLQSPFTVRQTTELYSSKAQNAGHPLPETHGAASASSQGKR